MKRCSWAALLVFILGVCTASLASASAQSKIVDWKNPGEFPFQGSYEDVCNLHSDVLTEEQCFRAIDQYEREECDVVYLQEGDIMEVSFTLQGKDKKETLRVAFGKEYEPQHEIRRALSCATGRPDGVKLVRPDECGNWAIETRPTKVATYQYAMPLRKIPITRIVQDNWGSRTGGYYFEGCGYNTGFYASEHGFSWNSLRQSTSSYSVCCPW